MLKVISSSPGDLEPVFNAMLENATRICEAKFGTLFRFDGGTFHRGRRLRMRRTTMLEVQQRAGPYLPAAGSALDRIVVETNKSCHHRSTLAANI